MAIKDTYDFKIPEGIEAKKEGHFLLVKGPKGESRKDVYGRSINVQVEGGSIKIHLDKKSRNEKRLAHTLKSHILNMLWGVKNGYHYKLRVASTHFPMTVKLQGDELSLANFLGEKIPRRYKVPKGVNVKVDRDIITVDSHDIELAGQTAASIESLTRITNKDRRVFQDGVYILEKSKRGKV